MHRAGRGPTTRAARPSPPPPAPCPQVFPKSIELMVPAICVALVAPAWLHEEATHRVVYVVICGTASLTMLARGNLG